MVSRGIALFMVSAFVAPAARGQEQPTDPIEALLQASADQIPSIDPETFRAATVRLAAHAPDRIAAYTVRQIRALSPEQLASLDVNGTGAWNVERLRALSPQQVAGLRPEQVAAFGTTQLRAVVPALTGEQVRALTDQQLRGIADVLTDEQHEALGERAPESAGLLRAIDAIRPGIRLVGDGYAQLTAAATESDADAAFGAGLEIEEVRRTWHLRSHLVIRKGTSPSVLDNATARGLSVLNPWVEDFHFGGQIDFGYTFGLLPTMLFGLSARLGIARTQWEVEAASTPVAADVTTFAFSFGPTVHYVVSQQSNYVEVWFFLGLGGFRAAAIGAGADDALLVAGHEAENDEPFIDLALGTVRNGWYSLDLELAIRINSVEIRALVIYVPPMSAEVAGLTGFTFIPSISVRTGAQLVDFASHVRGTRR